MLFAIATVFGAVHAAHAAEIVVTTDDNRVDFGGAQQSADLPGPDDEVSLHEAITAANNTFGADTITFDLARAEQIITLFDPLPALTDNETSIVGALDGSGIPVIEMRAGAGGPDVGFLVMGFSTTIRNLWLQLDTCIDIAGSVGNRIEGCVFGFPGVDRTSVGVVLRDGAFDNDVGGPALTQRNRFVFIGDAGVIVDGELTNANRVRGNVFGRFDDITPFFETEIGTGIVIRDGAVANFIGGMLEGEGNLFEEGRGHAIEMDSAVGNLILGNVIGRSGEPAAGGIFVANTSGVFIAGNDIDGSGGAGIHLENCADARIEENRIGMGIGHTGAGIELFNCTNAVIGGVGLGNVVSENLGPGIVLGDGTIGTRIAGNVIGASTGNGNGGHGVLIAAGASDNAIGWPDVAGMNAIENNGGHGVYIESGTSGNSVRFNTIFGNEEGSLTLEEGANNGVQPPELDRAFPRVEGTAPIASLVDVYRSDRDDPRGALEWVETAFAFGGGFFVVSTPPAELGELIVLSATAEGENTSALMTFCLQGECGMAEPEDPEPVNLSLGILAPFFCVDEGKSDLDRGMQAPAPDAAVVLLGLPLVFIAAGRRRR